MCTRVYMFMCACTMCVHVCVDRCLHCVCPCVYVPCTVYMDLCTHLCCGCACVYVPVLCAHMCMCICACIVCVCVCMCLYHVHGSVYAPVLWVCMCVMCLYYVCVCVYMCLYHVHACVHAHLSPYIVRIHVCTLRAFLHTQTIPRRQRPSRGHRGPHLGWTGGAGAHPRAGGTAPTSSLHLWCMAGSGSCRKRSAVRPSGATLRDLRTEGKVCRHKPRGPRAASRAAPAPVMLIPPTPFPGLWGQVLHPGGTP